jgi:hypothetical protein
VTVLRVYKEDGLIGILNKAGDVNNTVENWLKAGVVLSKAATKKWVLGNIAN